MEGDFFTNSEFLAYKLIDDDIQTTENSKIHEAANKIILLAEQIKAERAIVAMI